MRATDILLVSGYVLVSTTAIMMVKQFATPALEAWRQAPGLSGPGSLLMVGAMLYAVSFGIWMAVLARNELSVVYPVVTGLTLVSTSIGSWLLFKESFDVWRIAGIGVIFVGIVLVTRPQGG